MAEVPPTRPSLLVRMRDAHDQAAWADFVRLYAPAIYRFARRKGLQDADAADLTQEVLRSVADAIAAALRPGVSPRPSRQVLTPIELRMGSL